MNRIAFTCLSILCLLAVSPAEAQEDRYRGISFGSAPASGTSAEWGTATAILDYPIAQITTMLHDYGAFQDYLPHFRTSRVLSRRGNRAIVYVQVTAMNDSVTLWAQMDVRSREEEGRRIITADMTEGNLDHFRVRWELERVDDTHTRIRFRLLADPDLPIPSSLITGENVKFAKKVVASIRERLSSLGG